MNRPENILKLEVLERAPPVPLDRRGADSSSGASSNRGGFANRTRERVTLDQQFPRSAIDFLHDERRAVLPRREARDKLGSRNRAARYQEQQQGWNTN